jgi:hypothetical protein
VDRDLCIRCRGIKHLCGLERCPYVDYSYLRGEYSSGYSGISPPDVFIGHHGYPRVLVSALSSVSEIPSKLFPLDLDSILRLRGSLYRVGEEVRVDRGSRLIERIQEISLSYFRVSIDAELYRVEGEFSIDQIHTPLGPRLYARRIDLTENPRVPPTVERVFGDSDLRAYDAIYYLYRNELPDEYLRRLLSAGTLGLRVERKLVPTRWAITAVDDILGKNLIEEVRWNDDLESPIYAHGSYMWNDFYILIMPGPWGFEMFENWYGRGMFNEGMILQGDYETHFGRKSYASNVTGAYYAARLAVLEYLKRIGRRGSAIVYRVVGSEYRIPLGVWVIRETVREALRNSQILYGKNIKEFEIIPEEARIAFEKSRTIRMFKEQKRLDSYG